MLRFRFSLLFAALALSACAHHGAATSEPQAAPSEGVAESSSPTASADNPGTAAAVETREVSYDVGSVHMKGFMAYPAHADGKRPGVLVVHEWWGLNEYVRMRATKLAEMGYVALAVDMYGEGKNTTHPEDAKKFMMEVVSNVEEGVKRFEAAKALLAADPRTDASKIAAIGYCFGGAVVLQMARNGSDLDAVASFHGNLASQSPMKKGAFKGKIFVAHGAADPFVPAEQAEAFKKEMDAAGANYEFVAYEGAMHGFTNPAATEAGKAAGLPLAYDAEADTASWAKLDALLAQL